MGFPLTKHPAIGLPPCTETPISIQYEALWISIPNIQYPSLIGISIVNIPKNVHVIWIFKYGYSMIFHIHPIQEYIQLNIHPITYSNTSILNIPLVSWLKHPSSRFMPPFCDLSFDRQVTQRAAARLRLADPTWTSRRGCSDHMDIGWYSHIYI